MQNMSESFDFIPDTMFWNISQGRKCENICIKSKFFGKIRNTRNKTNQEILHYKLKKNIYLKSVNILVIVSRHRGFQ